MITSEVSRVERLLSYLEHDPKNAALLFDTAEAAFEGRNGYFQSFSRGVEVDLDVFKDFGTRYDLLAGRHRFKPYPCGGLTHTTIQAALDLRPRVDGRLDEIKNVHCFVARAAGQRAATSYPTTTEAATTQGTGRTARTARDAAWGSAPARSSGAVGTTELSNISA